HRKQEKVILSGFLYTLGRLTSYTGIGALIYFRFSKFQIAKLFQGNGEKFLGPIMILIGLVMLDVIKLDFLTKGNLTERLSERFKKIVDFLGSYLLGAIFALAFCPYSGALFFGMMIPMTLAADAGLLLAVVFSLGTGIPVIIFAFVIAYSIEKLGTYFNAITKVEKVMRVVAGLAFVEQSSYVAAWRALYLWHEIAH
ncbi:MAG: sulfite exporter TauE/SafE family protein, partial [Saprospiraceae bacterium]|nr:sulfite exporter TauE/SafE family protein [Saprospiraceae bacterium]